MLSPSNLLSLALLYICALFAVAWYADRVSRATDGQDRAGQFIGLFGLRLAHCITRLRFLVTQRQQGQNSLFIFTGGRLCSGGGFIFTCVGKAAPPSPTMPESCTA